MASPIRLGLELSSQSRNSYQRFLFRSAIRRNVLLSSTIAVTYTPKAGKIFTEDWNETAIKWAQEPGKDICTKWANRVSKTLSEKGEPFCPCPRVVRTGDPQQPLAMWEFYRSNKNRSSGFSIHLPQVLVVLLDHVYNYRQVLGVCLRTVCHFDAPVSGDCVVKSPRGEYRRGASRLLFGMA